VLVGCHALVYLISAAAVGTAISSEVFIGTLALIGYLIGASYIKRAETLRPQDIWPVVLLAFPLIYLFRGANLLAGLGLVGWMIYGLSFLMGSDRNPAATEVHLTAGISLVDATIISAIPNHTNTAILAVVGFGLNLVSKIGVRRVVNYFPNRVKEVNNPSDPDSVPKT